MPPVSANLVVIIADAEFGLAAGVLTMPEIVPMIQMITDNKMVRPARRHSHLALLAPVAARDCQPGKNHITSNSYGHFPRWSAALAAGILGSFLTSTRAAEPTVPAADGRPQLRHQGTATQLVVDGKPFLILGGELFNSSSSSLEYMRPIWDRLVAKHLNTALAGVSWELIEPEEGRFDFALLDGLVRDARAHQMKLVLLWFGSWKNGTSSYAPVWVKRDTQRFPRVRLDTGDIPEVLTPLSTASADADAKAFAALMSTYVRSMRMITPS